MTNNNRLSSDELLNILFLSPLATAIYTTNDIIIQNVNQAMLSFWGKDSSIIGLPLADAVPVLRGQPFIGMLQSVWQTGKTIEGSDTPAQLEIDGKIQTFYYDFVYRAIKDDAGKVICVFHTASDVTDRYFSKQRVREMDKTMAIINLELSQANKQLLATNSELSQSQATLLQLNDNLTESESQLQFAIDAASLGTFDLNPVTNKFSSNDRLKEWFGLKRNREIELSVATDVIAGADRETVIAAIKRAMEYSSGGIFNIEYTIINPLSNVPRIVRAQGKTLFNMDRQPIRFSGILQDITDEKNAQRELIETNHRLEIALDAGKLGSYELELNSGKMICTDQFKLIYGRPVNEPFNFPDLLETVLPEYRAGMQKQIKNAVDRNATYHSEYQITWPDGSLHWISASGKPRFNDSNEAVRMVGVTYDITESKTNEQRKDDFISIASHELKTPITSLKSSLQLLNRMKDDPSPKMLPKLIEQSNRSMERISTLIEDLLNVSRMNEGQLHLSKSSFSVSEMLTGCCSHVRAAGKHQLIFEGDTNLQIYADEHRIDQVVVNLVNNAVKYAPNANQIYLQVVKENNMAKISVRDNGPGIDPHKLPHLFDRYYRADYSGIQYSGLGLGLYISAEIVRKHGGQIGAVSELGKGSTFWFTLPL